MKKTGIKNRCLTWLLTFSMIFTVFGQNFQLVAATDEVLIKTGEDLMQLAENCSLDTWSQKKTVKLLNDIELGDLSFQGIPTFGGTFEGNGHTISGLKLEKSGSVQGFFRYIQESGRVSDLNLKGSVRPSGTKKMLGGLAGSNSGVIRNCTVNGSIEGESYIGGIAGNNEAAGKIIDCKASGSLSGQHYTGGIAGQNLGVIIACENQMAVNTTENDQSVTLDDLESLDIKKLNNTENTKLKTDMGGITGYSTGVIQGCHNQGKVGYPHVGYNIGGIAGRQSGYISECTNAGEIYGRKDVGGIAGQMEPYIELNYSEDKISKIRDELNKLQQLMDQGKKDASGFSDEVTEQLSKTKEYIDAATDYTTDLADQTGELVNSGIDSINDLSARVSSTITRLTPVMDQAKSLGEKMTEAVQAMEKTVDTLKITSEEGRKVLDQTRETLETLKDNVKDYNKALDILSQNMKSLRNALGTDSEMETAASQLTEALTMLHTSMENLKTAGEHFSNAMEQLRKLLSKTDSLKQVSQAARQVQSAISETSKALSALKKAEGSEDKEKAQQALNEALQHLQTALQAAEKANENLGKLPEEIKNALTPQLKEEISEEIKEGTRMLQEGLKTLSKANLKLQEALKSLKQGLDDLQPEKAIALLEEAADELKLAGRHTENVIEEAAQTVQGASELSGSTDDVLDRTKETIKLFEEASKKAEETVGSAGDIIRDLSLKPQITFPNITSEYMDTVHGIGNAFGNISDSLETLNQTASSNNTRLSDDLSRISDQFYVVMNLMLDINTDQDDDLKSDIESFKEDVSDEDTEENTRGKAEGSENQGKIQGDVNVGGITGSMAIEYDFDPEDDVKRAGKTSLKFQYLARTVIRGCTNKGEVISKKNYAGSIVGRMDLGTVMDCCGYGSIKSTEGDYVGGIAGASYSHIKKSFAMCIISGEKYVGGIAGYASRLTNNYAMVEIEDAVETQGAIAGQVDDLKELSQNYFVNRGKAAVDGISYEKKAEPVSYETFCKTEGLPQAFKSLVVTFVADGKEVGKVPFEFGGHIDESKLPKVPEKDGYYGRWPEFDFDHLTFGTTLEAVYLPYTKAVASSDKKGDKSIALVQGTFEDNTVLKVTKAAVKRPSGTGSDAEVWQVAIEGASYDQDEKHELRLLAPQSGKMQVYTLDQNGSWKKIKSKENGSYLVVSMEGKSGTYCLAKVSYMKELIMAGSGVICLLLLIMISKLKKSRTLKEKGQKL